jgi:hypothetical protein
MGGALFLHRCHRFFACIWLPGDLDPLHVNAADFFFVTTSAVIAVLGSLASCRGRSVLTCSVPLQ